MTFDRRTFLRRAGLGAAGAGALASGITPAVGAQSSIPPVIGALPGAGAGVPIGTLLDYASGPPSWRRCAPPATWERCATARTVAPARSG